VLITDFLFCPVFPQNRQTVMSNTAQWAKEKKDKIEKQ
jgi:hypothetical protein